MGHSLDGGSRVIALHASNSQKVNLLMRYYCSMSVWFILGPNKTACRPKKKADMSQAFPPLLRWDVPLWLQLVLYLFLFLISDQRNDLCVVWEDRTWKL